MSTFLNYICDSKPLDLQKIIKQICDGIQIKIYIGTLWYYLMVDPTIYATGQFYTTHLALDYTGTIYIIKYITAQPESYEWYLHYLNIRTTARDYALQFNKYLSESIKVKFPKLVIVKFDDLFNGHKFAFMEKFIYGKFNKFNNNLGWVSGLDSSTEKCDIAQAFSHFTFYASKGSLIIVDIQGCVKPKRCVFTNPEIHILGDLQWAGIHNFFNTHICNDICKQFMSEDRFSVI
jgi:hypothetical protein